PIAHTLANVIWFDEENYEAGCARLPTEELVKKRKDKDRQILLCAGGIGAGLVVSLLAGGLTSLLGCVFSVGHVKVLHRQIKIIDKFLREQDLAAQRKAIKLMAFFRAVQARESTFDLMGADERLTEQRLSALLRQGPARHLSESISSLSSGETYTTPPLYSKPEQGKSDESSDPPIYA
ncbi:hypothetical protein FRC17_002034, partial [Serendipita sp. 399]